MTTSNAYGITYFAATARQTFLGESQNDTAYLSKLMTAILLNPGSRSRTFAKPLNCNFGLVVPFGGRPVYTWTISDPGTFPVLLTLTLTSTAMLSSDGQMGVMVKSDSEKELYESP